ncbi:MAG: hypothetical protein JWL76_1173 [Thermoleophilia bacterium]|nr:hypothetical protein [Thermoleophilia bacterium]
MLQGSEAPTARSVGITRKGPCERHSGPRMGNRIASPGSGSRQAEMDFAATHRSTAGDRRPRGTPPQGQHDGHAAGSRPNTAPPARRRGAGGFRHAQLVHNCPTARTSNTATLVPRPKRRLRGTTARSHMPSHTGATRHQQLRPRSPSNEHSGRSCNFFWDVPGHRRDRLVASLLVASCWLQSPVAPGNVQAGCSTAWYIASSPLGWADCSSAARTSGWSRSRPGSLAGASIGAMNA